MKRKIGDILIELGVIDSHQLNSALEHQKRYKHKIRLGTSLVILGFITEEKLTQVLSRYLNIPMVDLNLEYIGHDVLRLVEVEVAERHHVIPFKIFEENRKKILGLAMADPTNLEPIDVIQFSTGFNIRPFVAAPSEVEAAIQKYYHGIMVDGISYVGKANTKGDKVKIISKGEEITWHDGVLGGSAENLPPPPAISSDPSSGINARVKTQKSATDNAEVMGEMLKLMRESNAMMKALIKKGIISEEDIQDEIEK